jgi:Zn-dependent protease
MTLDPIVLAGSLIGLFTAFVVHEFAHAWAAYSLGDPTSKYEGRLTLNPLVHLDPIGSLVMIFSALSTGGQLLLGWAKPVMFNRDNFRQPYLDGALVALAGPVSNLVLAFAVGLAGFVLPLGWVGAYLIKANVGFGLFNSFPLPPLDGWKITQGFVPRGLAISMQRFEDRLGSYAPALLLLASFVLIGPVFRPLYNSLVGLLVGAH